VCSRARRKRSTRANLLSASDELAGVAADARSLLARETNAIIGIMVEPGVYRPPSNLDATQTSPARSKPFGPKLSKTAGSGSGPGRVRGPGPGSGVRAGSGVGVRSGVRGPGRGPGSGVGSGPGSRGRVRVRVRVRGPGRVPGSGSGVRVRGPGPGPGV